MDPCFPLARPLITSVGKGLSVQLFHSLLSVAAQLWNSRMVMTGVDRAQKWEPREMSPGASLAVILLTCLNQNARSATFCLPVGVATASPVVVMGISRID